MAWYCPTCDKEIPGIEVEVGKINDEQPVTTYHVVKDGQRVTAIHRVRAVAGWFRLMRPRRSADGDAAGGERE
jgi:hypothetical protein